jgi:hypothetical protein
MDSLRNEMLLPDYKVIMRLIVWRNDKKKIVYDFRIYYFLITADVKTRADDRRE